MNNANQFTETFGSRPDLTVQAPGRLEVLGNHTDYNEGFVLSVAVDRYTEISFKALRGGTTICQVSSPSMNDGIREFDLDNIATPALGKDWTNYIRGVIVELQKLGKKIDAFQALITSNVPLSAGMSSSAALEMAVVTGLNELYNLGLTVQEKARIGQGCENNYIGANTGLMDQLTSLCGKKGQLVISEYRDLTISHTPLPPELALVVINSNVAHDLSQEYNERREQCERAAATLGIKALRDVDLETLQANKSKLQNLDYRRARHVVEENARVHQAQTLLAQNNWAAFGALLYASHDSSRHNFENSCPELDCWVDDIARASPLCLGARLSGGGFGGISIHLVYAEHAKEYSTYAVEAYAAKTGEKTEALVCQSANGACVTTSRWNESSGP